MKFIALAGALFLAACGETLQIQIAGLDVTASGLEVQKVPIVRIQNRNWSDADVFVNGIRLTTVKGIIGDEVRALKPFQISPDGRYTFSFHLIAGDTYTLNQLTFVEGRKLKVDIASMISGSIASIE